MKISEFISKYKICPMCNADIDCLLYLNLTDTIFYKKISENYLGFQFERQKEKHIKVNYEEYMKQHIKGCNDCAVMPSVFTIMDRFVPPDGILICDRKASIRLECTKNDFLCYSTTFNIFEEEQLIDIHCEAFEINWNRIVFNDYKINKTTLRILNKENVSDISKDIGLIPLDKWPIGDKIKLMEKIEKLLALM